MYEDLNFPWYYRSCSVNLDNYEPPITDNVKDKPFMLHQFYNQMLDYPISSNWWYLMYSFVNKVESVIDQEIKGIQRVKTNLTTPDNFSEDTYSYPHTDSQQRNFYTALYYVNDSDGDTLFFTDGEIDTRVTPTANTLVVFPSNRIHALANGQTSEKRIVINAVFELMENV
jgi:hypothetical protein